MIVVESMMPDPWFHAQSVAYPIAEAVREEPYREARAGERVCGRYVLPPFQRPPVWTRAQQIKLVESVWGGLPIGTYCYNDAGYNHPCDGWLLDGQQRISSLVAYVAGEYDVYGWTFSALPMREQRRFLLRPFGALKTQIIDEAACREVYDRLAYGGTSHA